MVTTETREATGLAAPSARRRTQPVDVACAHCGLPVPDADDEPGPQFCCVGCSTVYAVLRAEASGDEDALRARLESGAVDGAPDAAADLAARGLAAARARRESSARSYAELDDPEYLAKNVVIDAEGASHARIVVQGIHCAACIWLLEKLPRCVPGVERARASASTGAVHVVFRASETKLSTIARQLARLGYPPAVHVSSDGVAARTATMRSLMIRMAVAGASAGNVMLMAFALYSGQVTSMEAAWEAFFRWGSLVATLPALFYSARPFFEGARAALKTGTPHMDVPISLALLVGFVWGLRNTITGQGEVYFDTLTTVIFLLLVGRWLQARQHRFAGNTSALIQAMTPRAARRVRDGATEDVPLSALARGDLVEVRAGETIPVDGEIAEGATCLDLSLLTGESRPVTVEAGDSVHAGTTNVRSPIRVRVEEVGAQTRLGRLVRLVESIAATRAPIVTLADRLAGRFVVWAIGLAVVTTFGWYLVTGDAGVALDRGVALLIITCPCALGMATPLAIEVALARAAGMGLLLKGGPVVERLASLRRVLCDKTGTLTSGRLSLVAWEGEKSAQPWVQALERGVNHPIAVALARDLPASDVEATEVHQILGRGVSGRVAGHEVRVGAAAHVEAVASERSARYRATANRFAQTGLTPLLAAVDGEVVAALALGDPLRPEAVRTVRRLEALGCEVHVASGDDPQVVEHVGRALGIPLDRLNARCAPEEKVELVRTLAPCAMVGDGVNDAAALAGAEVGIAMQGGAEASLAASDVFMTRSDLGLVADLIEGSRRTLRVIRRNLAFSLMFNVVGVTLVVFGVLNPLMAAVLMPLSSITVISSSYRGRTFAREEGP